MTAMGAHEAFQFPILVALTAAITVLGLRLVGEGVSQWRDRSGSRAVALLPIVGGAVGILTGWWTMVSAFARTM